MKGQQTLGSVDLLWSNFALPYGQRLWPLSPALSVSHVGDLHIEASALDKQVTNSGKNNR
ncbi:MAG: hypothetical protein LPH21_07720 [Shewanella sp.]|nr:hypothetical protein [Shewanella sp.]